MDNNFIEPKKTDEVEVPAPTPTPQPISPVPSKSEVSPTKKSHTKLIAGLVIVVILVIVGILLVSHKKASPALNNESPIRIGLSIPTASTVRWPNEASIMEKQASASGANVIEYNANGDTNTQISQIENLIAQKVNVIIVAANDSNLIAPVIKSAHKAGIKVIAYDRMINGPGITEYISFSSYQVGVDWANYIVSNLPANLKPANVAFLDGAPTDDNSPLLRQGVMSVLSPLIKSGKIDLVFDQNITNWDPSIAYSTFKTDVSSGTRIDAVIGGNDEIANSVIEVLQSMGEAGKIPVTGQDGELAAIQRIEAGTQALTIYKPGAYEADLAIKDAIALAKGKSVKSNTSVNNGSVVVPSYNFMPIPVTKTNINSVIIKGGVYTSGQIFSSQAGN